MVKVLFVCSGNTCRSPMAEKIFKQIAKERKLKCKCESAGLTAVGGDKITAEAKLALARLGIRNVRHKAKVFSLDMLGEYDYCIAMSEKHKSYIGKFKNVYSFSDLVDGATDVADPFGCDAETYYRTAKQLCAYINVFIRGIEK